MKDRFILRLKRMLHWSSEACEKVNITTSSVMLLVQLAGAFSILYGISFWSIPIAFIVGGVGAIVAVEMQSHEPKEDIDEILAIQARIKTALASGEDPFAKEGVPFTPTWVAYASSLRVQR